MKKVLTVISVFACALSLFMASCSQAGSGKEEAEKIEKQGDGKFALEVSDTLSVGAFNTIKVLNQPDEEISFISLDPEIVSVNSVGRIKGLKEGTAKIFATSAGTSVSATINVSQGNIISFAKPSYALGDGSVTGNLEDGIVNRISGFPGRWANTFFVDTDASLAKGDNYTLRFKMLAQVDDGSTGDRIGACLFKFDETMTVYKDEEIYLTSGEEKLIEVSETCSKSIDSIRMTFDLVGIPGPTTFRIYDFEMIVENAADTNDDPETFDIYGSDEVIPIGKDGNVTVDGQLTTYVADDTDYTTLVWSDEFNGNSLGMDNWTYELGGGGWGNGEQQRYTDQNITVTNGLMIITADQYNRSSRIFTKQKKYFQYGKIVARMKIEQGKGSWPAFWMMGSQSNFQWPYCGEIDIFEDVNNLPISYSTIHWNPNGPDIKKPYDHWAAGEDTQKNSCEGSLGDIDTNEWHEYGLIWTEDMLQFTFDNHLIFQKEIEVDKGMGCFQTPFYIIFNYAMGGEWPWVWNSDEFTGIPWHMYVDWVRVFQ